VAAKGQYGNMSVVIGLSPTEKKVMDEDPSHYYGEIPEDPKIDIEKHTNGEDADTPTGPVIVVGDPVNWMYYVSNPGNVPLSGIVVTDDNGTSGDTSDDFNPTPVMSGGYNVGDTNTDGLLDPGEIWQYSAKGVAAKGQYGNMSVVIGLSPTEKKVMDEDPSHYYAKCSCDPPPIADFTADVTHGIGTLCVQFKNLSQYSNTFLWEFGDGTTSKEKDPHHCFRNPPLKYYTIKLTAYCDTDMSIYDSIKKVKFITVVRPAEVNFSAYPIIGEPGFEVQFMNLSGGLANKWLWDFGDGITLELQHSIMSKVHPTHIYAEEGEYTVSLHGSGQGGVDEVTMPNLIYVDEDYVGLTLLESSASVEGSGLDNAIDHDVSSSNAIAYMLNSEAYGTFEFSDQGVKFLYKVRILANSIFGTLYKNHLLKDFEILVSMDGENYTSAFIGTLATQAEWDVFEFAPVAAKYVKLKLLNARGAGSPYVALNEFQTFAYGSARAQIIHNAADPAAEMVDVYLNGNLLLDDFAFRAATPFVYVPAGVELAIGIAPNTSTSSGDVIATFTPTLMADEKYVVIANGVLNPSAFAANPDEKSTGFTLFVKAGAREMAETSGNVEFAVLHGSTDAPTVDVYARDVAQLVDDAAYGDITDYLSVPAADYVLDITDASGTTTVVSYLAPLSGLADGAAFVFASGFFDPSANGDGPGFGVFAALANGDVLELPVSGGSKALAGLTSDDNYINGDQMSVVEVPTNFALDQNYPNPFNPVTTIQYQLPDAADVVISIYNIRGQLITTLVNSRIEAGYHQSIWNGTNSVGNIVSGGTYIVNIRATNDKSESFNISRKMVFLK